MTLSQSTTRHLSIQILALIIIGCLVFAQSYHFDFINYDDPAILLNNTAINQGLTPSGVQWAFTEVGALNLWQPITYISHMIDVELFGIQSAGGHHLINVFFHLIAALGLFFLLGQYTNKTWLALILASIWMIHPQRAESVMWISERKDVLSGAFCLWAWWAWERYRKTTSTASYSLSLFLFFLASLSKPSVIPLPLILLLQTWITRQAPENLFSTIKKWGIKLLPFFGISALVACLTIYFQQQGGLSDTGQMLPLIDRLLLMPIGLFWYLQSTITPYPGHFFNYPPENILFSFILSTVSILVLGALSYIYLRNNKLFLVGCSTAVSFWLPVSGIIPVSYYFVADRYAYLIQIGFIIMAIAICIELFKRTRLSHTSILITSGTLVLITGLAGYLRAAHWESSKSLFTREMQVNPRSLLAPIQLGIAAENENRFDQALDFFEIAATIQPDSGLAWTNQGRMQEQLQKPEQAILCYKKAMSAKRLHTPNPYLRLVQIYAETQNFTQCEELLKQALLRFPSNQKLKIDTGSLHLKKEDFPTAIVWFDKVLQTDPTHPDALQGKAFALIKMGKKKEGVALLRQILETHPERTNISNYLEKNSP